MLEEQQEDIFMEAWAIIINMVKCFISSYFNQTPFIRDYINMFKIFILNHILFLSLTLESASILW